MCVLPLCVHAVVQHGVWEQVGLLVGLLHPTIHSHGVPSWWTQTHTEQTHSGHNTAPAGFHFCGELVMQNSTHI